MANHGENMFIALLTLDLSHLLSSLLSFKTPIHPKLELSIHSAEKDGDCEFTHNS